MVVARRARDRIADRVSYRLDTRARRDAQRQARTVEIADELGSGSQKMLRLLVNKKFRGV